MIFGRPKTIALFSGKLIAKHLLKKMPLNYLYHQRIPRF